MSAEPPAEIRGSGTPSTGSRPSTTAMFTRACPITQTMTPPVVILAKLSRVARRTRTKAIARTMNSTRTTIAPINLFTFMFPYYCYC